jgi:predicted regulator of Ras-like GTPase activity (Roadblock/LC7/MglB family)
MIVAEDHRVATTPYSTPRYRFYEEAPETVSLPARELVEHLPGELHRRGAATEGTDSAEGAEGAACRMVEIPCADLLGGKIPQIALGRLHDLLPDLVQVPGDRDAEERITLPPGWIALHFRMATHKVEVEPEGRTEDAKESQIEKDNEVSHEERLTDAYPPQKAEVIAEVEVVEAVEVAEVGAGKEPNRSPSIEADKTLESAKSSEDSATTQESETNTARRKSFLDSLPIFRRRSVAPEAVTAESKTASVEEPAEKKAEAPSPASVVEPLPVVSSKALTVERLWKLDPQEKLADPSALQALFMTEEKLTLESVISKAGQLPGLNACVLAHGDQVLCTSNATTGVDLRTLSTQAMTMLGQIRETSANMGLGAVPAVTLHAEQGALSFLHNGELCLLVLHADRGFVPGVRERLQQMLVHLAEAKPALPPSSPASQSESLQ